ncbi:MAG: hypothetical protein J6P93_04440 [Alphaproteobacteria bacterium]|nr:hypothetical protein [Alphaproteobacteria bacterium]
MKKILFLAVAVVFATSLTACTTPSCCKHAEDQQVTCGKDCKCGCHEGKECKCSKCKCGCHEGKKCNCPKDENGKCKCGEKCECAKHNSETGTCNKK